MIYLLDANVVSYFFDVGRQSELAAAARHCPMAMVDEVRQELEKDPKRGGRPFRDWLAKSDIRPCSIEVGSAASATLAELLSLVKNDDKGLGERASIALAAFDPSMTFVTNDGNARQIALRELWAPGERVMRLSVFLRRLFDKAVLVDPTTLDGIIKRAYKREEWPTWWATWRAGLVGATPLDESS